MPNDREGGQGTQRSGEQNQNKDTDQKVPQQGQQRQQGGQGQQESENDRMPGGGKGNR